MAGYKIRLVNCLALVLILIAGIAGCGAKTARISGKVLLAGEAIPRADIEFVPTADDAINFRGIGLADGGYQIDYGVAPGLPVGDYLAKVTIYRTRDGKPLPEGEEGEVLKSSGKVKVLRYTVELPVESSSSNADLNLDTGTVEEVNE